MMAEKIGGMLILATICLAAGMYEQRAKQDLQPSEAARFTVTKPGSDQPTQFAVLKYKSNWYQGTAEMNTEFAHLVGKSEFTPEVLAAYQKVLVERNEPALCTDGQRIADDQCLKCDGNTVMVVSCKSDPLRTTPQRSTYLAVLHE